MVILCMSIATTTAIPRSLLCSRSLPVFLFLIPGLQSQCYQRDICDIVQLFFYRMGKVAILSRCTGCNLSALNVRAEKRSADTSDAMLIAECTYGAARETVLKLDKGSSLTAVNQQDD